MTTTDAVAKARVELAGQPEVDSFSSSSTHRTEASFSPGRSSKKILATAGIRRRFCASDSLSTGTGTRARRPTGRT